MRLAKRLALFLLLPALALAVPSLDFAYTTTALAANGTACTAIGGASCTVIAICSGASGSLCSSSTSPANISAFTNFALTVHNVGAANAITTVLVEMSDDGANWEIWDSTNFAALAASTNKSIQFNGNSRRFLRLEGQSASGTTAGASIAANNGG